MDTQLDRGQGTALDRLGQRLLPGQARRVGHGIGELSVLAGRVWITGDGPDDRVLEAGQRMRLERAQHWVIESLDAGGTASVAWRPRASVLQRLGLRERLGAVFAALARKAAPSASRAQGCMP